MLQALQHKPHLKVRNNISGGNLIRLQVVIKKKTGKTKISIPLKLIEDIVVVIVKVRVF